MKNKKTAFTAVFLYLLITSGIWAFLVSYTNSYNKLSTQRLLPASAVIKSEQLYLSAADKTVTIDISAFKEKNKFYYQCYLLEPDEIKLTSLILFLINSNCSI